MCVSHRLIPPMMVSIIVFLAGCTSAAPAEENTLRRGVVERGSIDEVVSSTGAVFPQERVSLSFEAPGIVEQVFVEIGDSVTAGQPLASLDAASLEVAVRQAELGVRAQELARERLSEPASAADLAAAQAEVDSARASYAQLTNGAEPEDVRIAQLQYEQAYQVYLQADIDLRAVQWYAPPPIVDQYRAQFATAQSNLEIARLRLEQVRADPNQHALAAAWAAVVEAQARRDRLQTGPSPLEIARAEAQIQQARVALERAQRQRDTATLLAPFTGTVAEVNLRPGMVAPVSTPAIILIDASHLHVEVDIDELDVARVIPGQPALITLDALPATTIEGQVTGVAPAASVTVGAVTYSARIDFDPADLPVLPGMTATVDIVVQRLENVLLVPNWAIRFDRATGQAYVSVLYETDQLRDTPVMLGLRGTTHSQVIAGLEEGQIVAVSLSGADFTFL